MAAEADPSAQPEPPTAPEAPAVAKRTDTGLISGSVATPNAAVAIVKISFGCCILNNRCRGLKQSLEQQCLGCNNYTHFCRCRILLKDDDGYTEWDVLCPSCDKQSDPATLCFPVTQYDEDTSESGEEGSYVDDEDQCYCGCEQDASDSRHYCLYSMKWVLQIHYHPDQEVSEVDGSLSYCLQCCGKVARGRKQSDDEEEEEPISRTLASGQCCCGCGMEAAQSNHYCIHSGKQVMAWRFHESQEVEEGYGSKALCKRCYNSIAPMMEHPTGKL
jgi:hypothetical protein